MDSSPPADSGDTADNPEVDQSAEFAQEAEEQPKFTEDQLNTLIDTYKLFIKKKQPNSVCSSEQSGLYF